MEIGLFKLIVELLQHAEVCVCVCVCEVVSVYIVSSLKTLHDEASMPSVQRSERR